MSKYFELLEQTGHQQDLFRTSGSPAAPVVTAVRKPIPALPQDPPQRVAKSTPLPMHWLNRIKKEARTWRQHIQLRSNHRGTNLDVIAREEEIRLVQRVFQPARGRSPQVVLFCGVDADAGSALICAHASQILAAQPEESVCLVDANLRSSSLHRYFGIENVKGLAEAVLERGPIKDFAQRVLERNLWVMPSGVASAGLSVSLVAEQLQSRMVELRSVFKRVVIHSPPLGLDTDPLLLGRWTDGVVLVVEAHSTRRETARRAKENLETADVRMLGVVLNNRTFPIPDALYRRL